MDSLKRSQDRFEAISFSALISPDGSLSTDSGDSTDDYTESPLDLIGDYDDGSDSTDDTSTDTSVVDTSSDTSTQTDDEPLRDPGGGGGGSGGDDGGSGDSEPRTYDASDIRLFGGCGYTPNLSSGARDTVSTTFENQTSTTLTVTAEATLGSSVVGQEQFTLSSGEQDVKFIDIVAPTVSSERTLSLTIDVTDVTAT